MNRPADAPLTLESAGKSARGSAAAFWKVITNLGSRYVLGAPRRNCRTGKMIDEEQVQAARKEVVLSVLSQIATKFRKNVGEALPPPSPTLRLRLPRPLRLPWRR